MFELPERRRTIGFLLGHLLCLTAICVASRATASAFAIIENSASGQGMAFAGGGAIAQDASAAWFNPAGIVRLDDQFQISGSYIMPALKYRDRGSMLETPLGNLALLPDSEHQDHGAKDALVPNVYLVKRLNDRFSLGLAINAPFGLVTQYDDNWIGRYQAVESEVKTINVNPSVAWKIDRHWSIAAGVSVDYMDVKLTNALDFATICASEILAVCPNGALPGQGGFDGFVSNTGNDVSFGANLGLLWSPGDMRVSLTWRSEIEHHLKGDAVFSLPSTLGGLEALPDPLGSELAAIFTNSNIKANVTLPDSAAFAIYYQLTPRLGIASDVVWTDWADIQAIQIEFDNPLTPTGIEELGFKSVWRYALGVQFELDDHWTLRTGTAYDESPTPNDRLRSARLPDTDRTWLSVGASYQLNEDYSIDFGYSHLFVKDTNINRLGETNDRLLGEFAASVDILSLQLNGRF
ncbi:MAG: outer membrane protein transport protein [Halioglobus sp.]